MILFNSDYTEGAHPRLMECLMETNLEQTVGYGEDVYCEEARAAIRKVCEAPDVDVQFLVGGTQTNLTVISAALRSYQGVICANTGHINAHETGAVEATGHKVLALPGTDGKITAEQVKETYDLHWRDESREHIVQPKMVYISHPTELGTLYTKAELQALHDVCKECGLYLFLDGARMGYGLMAPGTDVTLPDIANLCDVFYIGGTKVGAFCGEAVVFTKENAPRHFVTLIKQHGALLAKGWFLGVQFDTLFTDDLYMKISKNAITTAARLKEILKEKGYDFYIDSPTNQIFVILDNEKKKELEKEARFGFWEKYDETHTVVRIATSWGTTEEELNALIELI